MSTHRSFRSAMTWLHTWSGLLLGWVLYAIFITGTTAYFRPEITAWMQPETAVVAAPADAARAALKRLQQIAPESKRWLVSLPDDRSRELKIYWEDPQSGKRFKNEDISQPGEKNSVPRATLGGEFFYRFHFQLMLPHPWGRFLACTAALFMFVALISGIVTHRRFFKDLFLLRLGRDGRRPWLDFHNVTAVLALPFYLMISYSALVIFTPMLMPLAAKFLVPPKPVPPAATAGANPTAAKPAIAPDTASWIAPDKFEAMLAHVEKTWGTERSVKRIEVTSRGTPQASATFTRDAAPSTSYVFTDREVLKFSGLTGLPLAHPAPPAKSLGTRIRGVFYGLHLAHFAGPALRTLFFLMGTMGAAMVGTGLVLWTLKRKDRLTESGRGGRFGYGLVSRLNLVTITGLPIACAGFLWANRLIPAAQAGRADLETTCFLAVWGAAALHACIRPAKFAWKEQFIAAAVAFGALPLVDLLTAGRQLDTWPRADGVYLGFTITLLLLGALFGYGARKLHIRQARTETKGESP